MNNLEFFSNLKNMEDTQLIPIIAPVLGIDCIVRLSNLKDKEFCKMLSDRGKASIKMTASIIGVRPYDLVKFENGELELGINYYKIFRFYLIMYIISNPDGYEELIDAGVFV